jgi:hypothetical protein
MAKQYKNIDDLRREVKAVAVFDLIPHVLSINSDLLAALNDPEEGLYLPNSVEPVFEKDTIYTISTGRPGQLDVAVDWGQILQDIAGTRPLPPGHFFAGNPDGRWFSGPQVIGVPGPRPALRLVQPIHMNRRLYEHVKHHFKTHAQVPYRGCEAAVATIVSYLDSLCEHTFVPVGKYDLRRIVKPECQETMLAKESYESAFDKLWLEVQDFVGEDTWHMYYYYVKGTTLVIEKGMDFRIYDWHRRQLMEEVGFDPDFGGTHRVDQQSNQSAA